MSKTVPGIQQLWDYGHFNNPAFPDTLQVEEKDLGTLEMEDAVVQKAVMSFQDFMAVQIEPGVMAAHGRSLIIDGDPGPATKDVLFAPRCGEPDYRRSVQAVGSGNWPRCHGIGDFHAATVAWDTSGMPSFLKPVFDQVWASVVASYEELGLRLIRDDDNPHPNIASSFVQRSSGWIGLAQLGYNQRCGDSIWNRFLATYKGGRTIEQIINQWITLIKHEKGHGCGLEHSRGGVMNPSIMPGLPVSWKGDPSESRLRGWFGGEPIDSPGPDPGPAPPDGPRVILDGQLNVSIPENVKPGTYSFIAVPKPEV